MLSTFGRGLLTKSGPRRGLFAVILSAGALLLSAPHSSALAGNGRVVPESVELTKSTFLEQKSQLRVDAKIRQARKGPAYTVRLFDAMTDSLLAEKIGTTDKEVKFTLNGISETSVPCRVRVEVEDLSTAALVENVETKLPLFSCTPSTLGLGTKKSSSSG